jgi:hypothetical protein
MRVILAITPRDIRDGQRRSCWKCPVALSLKRRFPKADIEVDFEEVRVGLKSAEVYRKMEDWMSAFDSGKRVKPTAFCVDIR